MILVLFVVFFGSCRESAESKKVKAEDSASENASVVDEEVEGKQKTENDETADADGPQTMDTVAETNDGSEGTVFLEKGPRLQKGIPYIGRNVLPVFWGEYTVAGGSVYVFFTREEVLLSVEWQPTVCSNFQLLEKVLLNRRIYYYVNAKGWSVFIDCHSSLNACDFIEALLLRFDYLLGISKNDQMVPFPAVLDLGD